MVLTWAPPTLELLAFIKTLEVEAGVEIFPVKVGVADAEAGAAVGVCVAGGQRLEEDGGLVGDPLVLHTQPVILVNCFPSRN